MKLHDIEMIIINSYIRITPNNIYNVYSHNDKVSYVKKTIICFKSVYVYKKDKIIMN